MLRRLNLIQCLRSLNFVPSKCCSSTSRIVMMRGMDYDTTEDDVIGFFKPLGITPKKIYLKQDGSGRTAGFSEVEFNTHAEAVIALRKKNAFIGNRFIRLSLKTNSADNLGEKTTVNSESINTSPVEDTLSPPKDALKADEKRNVESLFQSGHVIRVKNMPWRITDQEIFDFFYPVGARPVSVQPIYDESGKRTGDFDVHFLSHEDLQKAAAKNNAYLRYKNVHLSLKQS